MHPEKDTAEAFLLRRAAKTGVPITGSFELTPRCNLNCKMCYVRMNRTEQEKISRLQTAEEWTALAEKLRDAGTLFLLLTGGEPLLQAAFAAEVLAALQAAGVHTAVETSGYAAPEVFRRVAGHADLVLFDVKHADPVQHRRWTGVDNAPILRNLAWLCTSGRPFVVRIPLIPGVNDTRENMLQTCLLIKDAPGLERVEILRYHKTAGAKYAMIGRTYAPGFDTGAEPRVHDVFSDYNLKTLIQ